MSKEGYAVFNPESRPVSELPVIYGFNNGGCSMWYHAQLIAEDGTALGDHICSNESFMLFDLGIFEGHRPDRHETFQQHYPRGYRMDFVSSKDVKGHTQLMEAFRLNQASASTISEEGVAAV